MNGGMLRSTQCHIDLLLSSFRNFLLFIPAGVPSLRAVLSYYTATANVNQEGDVHINDTLQGFGKLASIQFCTFFHASIH
jgi:solute carrier family 25 (mitochondrial phosphate transporter), member 23/24/25/41